MPICRLCRNSSILVKAHVIPEAFFRELRHNKDVPQLVTDTAGHFPKKSPIGIYDTTILCESCEKKFLLLDTYGISVLLTNFGKLFHVLGPEPTIQAYAAPDLNQKQLLRFLVSVLWRASVSSQVFYKRISLGAIEALARSVLEHPEQDVPPIFAALLTRWVADEENQSVAKCLMSPFRERFSGINVYRFYFGEIVAYIKVDQQPFPVNLRRYQLLAAPELVIIAKRLEESKDLKAMMAVLAKSDRNRELARRVNAGNQRGSPTAP